MELVKIIIFIVSLKPFRNKWTNSAAMHFSYYDDVKCLPFFHFGRIKNRQCVQV